MKARIENGIIKVYGCIPKVWKNIMNFPAASDQELMDHGFYEVEPAVVDADTQKAGELYFDEESRTFKHDIIDLEIDIDSEKAKRKSDLARAVEDEIMAALGVAVLEKLALGEPIPQETKDTVIALRAREQEVIDEIDAFTDAKLLRKYRIQREDVEASKTLLKSLRKI